MAILRNVLYPNIAVLAGFLVFEELIPWPYMDKGNSEIGRAHV
jgi:hypothetical protein